MHMQVFWTRWLGLGTLAAVALLLPACNDGHVNFLGYTSKPNYDTTIRTVFVPMCKNQSMIHGSIEFDVTRAIIQEIQLRTPYRVVHSLEKADTELRCTIKKRDKTVININQIGETREAQTTLIFEVLWLDRRPGKLGEVLSGKKRREGEPPVLGPDGKERPPTPVILAPTAFDIPEIGGTNATALTEIYKSLAVQVTNMMESTSGWK